MDENMARQFQHLRLNREACLGLRESVRPSTDAVHPVRKFCVRLYLAFYTLESDPDLETVDLRIDADEVMIINQHVSAEDGDWAKDILHQTRQVLYELTTGREAVRLASAQDAERLFEGLTLDPDEENKAAGDEPGEEVKV